MPRRITEVVASLLAAAVACTPCGRLAPASVEIELVDRDSGAPIRDATITYRVDGEPDDDVNAYGEGRYALGFQTPGTFEVRVDAPGYVGVDREYEVEFGECTQVDTQRERIELVPVR